MKNKIFIVGIIGIMLVFGFVFTACSSDSEDDSWTVITEDDLADLVGTWEGSTTIKIKAQDYSMNLFEEFGDDPLVLNIPATIAGLRVTLEYPADESDLTINSEVDIKWLLEAMVKSEDFKNFWPFIAGFVLDDPTLPLTLDNLWDFMNEDDGKPNAEKYWQANDPKSFPKETISVFGIEKNQNGDIKVTIPVAMFMTGEGDSTPPELDGEIIEIRFEKLK